MIRLTQLGRLSARSLAYYAVRTGQRPGIYKTWEECQANTYGHSNADFKKFETLEGALVFMKEVYTFLNMRMIPQKFPFLVYFNKDKVYADPNRDEDLNLPTGDAVKPRKTRVRKTPKTQVSAELATKEVSAEMQGSAGDNSGLGAVQDENRASASLQTAERKAVPKAITEMFYVFCDGASRKNPGLGGIGYVIYDPDMELMKAEGDFIGTEVTNNEAEYKSLLQALSTCILLGITKVHVKTDSLLVANQVNGTWECEKMTELHAQVQGLKEHFKTFKISHIPREMNYVADRLANHAIDQHIRMPHLKK
jgi:ribonuclease HI